MTTSFDVALIGADSFAREGMKRVLQDMALSADALPGPKALAGEQRTVVINEARADVALVTGAEVRGQAANIVALVAEQDVSDAMVGMGQCVDMLVLRSASFPAIAAAIRLAQEDLSALTFAAPAARTTAAPDPAAKQLSRMQTRVLEQLSKGLSNEEIGNALGITTDTVKIHLKAIFKKLNTANRTQVALWAADQGLRPTD